MKASRTDTDLGLVGVKYLSQYSMGSGSPSTLSGGAQFNEPVSKSPVDQGSSPNIDKLSTTFSPIISPARRLPAPINSLAERQAPRP